MSDGGDVPAQDHEKGPFQEEAPPALSGVGIPLFCEFLAFIAVVVPQEVEFADACRETNYAGVSWDESRKHESTKTRKR